MNANLILIEASVSQKKMKSHFKETDYFKNDSSNSNLLFLVRSNKKCLRLDCWTLFCSFNERWHDWTIVKSNFQFALTLQNGAQKSCCEINFE